MSKLTVLFCLFGVLSAALGHGMVMDPPNRGSMWRFDDKSPVNYDDNANFCGGFNVQWAMHGGKCGICGDDYGMKQPRSMENTGTYGRGQVAKMYRMGQLVEVTVLITANHKGWFQFSLCELTDPSKPEQEECFKVLKLEDGSDKYYLPSTNTGYYSTTVKLPDGVTCDRCVLRWTWNTGNSWGWCSDGSGAMGCGAQENFRTCSDISIV